MSIKVFTIQPSEQEKLDKWQKKIKRKYGIYGTYTYNFSPTGIGDKKEVYSNLTKETIDITDYSLW